MSQKITYYENLIQRQMKKDLMKMNIILGSKIGDCWFGVTYTGIKMVNEL